MLGAGKKRWEFMFYPVTGTLNISIGNPDMVLRNRTPTQSSGIGHRTEGRTEICPPNKV
jgi:hypothetical protein